MGRWSRRGTRHGTKAVMESREETAVREPADLPSKAQAARGQDVCVTACEEPGMAANRAERETPRQLRGDVTVSIDLARFRDDGTRWQRLRAARHALENLVMNEADRGRTDMTYTRKPDGYEIDVPARDSHGERFLAHGPYRFPGTENGLARAGSCRPMAGIATRARDLR